MGIVACCAITFRPLIEKVFASAKTKDQSSSASSNLGSGWKRIHVQHDVIVRDASMSHQSSGPQSPQEWELIPVGLEAGSKV